MCRTAKAPNSWDTDTKDTTQFLPCAHPHAQCLLLSDWFPHARVSSHSASPVPSPVREETCTLSCFVHVHLQATDQYTMLSHCPMYLAGERKMAWQTHLSQLRGLREAPQWAALLRRASGAPCGSWTPRWGGRRGLGWTQRVHRPACWRCCPCWPHLQGMPASISWLIRKTGPEHSS